MTPEVESLYSGDMRYDSAADAIEQLIYDRFADKDIPIVAAVGLLELVQLRFMNRLEGN